MTKRSPARHIGSALCCIIWLLLTAGCETPVRVDRLDAVTAQHQLTANVLTTDELSPQARNVLRRWVLSERYDDDPAGAITALHTIAADGRGDEDEVITLAEMAYLYGERTHQRPYFLAAAIYSFAFLFPEKGLSRRALTTRGSGWRPTSIASALPMASRPRTTPLWNSRAAVTSCPSGGSKSLSTHRHSNGVIAESWR